MCWIILPIVSQHLTILGVAGVPPGDRADARSHAADTAVSQEDVAHGTGQSMDALRIAVGIGSAELRGAQAAMENRGVGPLVRESHPGNNRPPTR